MSIEPDDVTDDRSHDGKGVRIDDPIEALTQAYERRRKEAATMTDNDDKKYPYCDSLNKELTAFDIVDLLKSANGDDRAKALEWLYPGQPVALIHHYPDTAQHGVATTTTIHIPGLFTALCFACQHVGKALKMELDWVKKKDPGDQLKIVIPRAPGG